MTKTNCFNFTIGCCLAEHIEDCFHLNDTISDSTRRICGKDYNQFRASQLSRSRQNAAGATTSPSRSSQNLSEVSSYNNMTSAEFPFLGEQAAAVDEDPSFAEPMGAEGGIVLELDHSIEGAGSPWAEEEDRMDGGGGGAMIPMTLDPSFVQQLVALFGAPDLNGEGTTQASSNAPVRFDIPLELAEQIYMHWFSSMISEENEERLNEKSRDLQSTMDMEYAFKLAQEEVSYPQILAVCYRDFKRVLSISAEIRPAEGTARKFVFQAVIENAARKLPRRAQAESRMHF